MAPALSLSPKPAAADPAPTLMQTLSAELPDLSQGSGAEASGSAREDFEARAQLDAPRSREALIAVQLPALVAGELDLVSARLRPAPLTAGERAEVLGATSFKKVKWRDDWFSEYAPSYPDGICFPDSRIQLSVRSQALRYASVEDHFRALFAHEYTHRLQNEGVITRALGVEIPAVAVELLRAIELAGMDRLRRGHITYIGEGVLQSFDAGVEWAGGDRAQAAGFYAKGFLAGAAYALSRRTGRPLDAWEFVRRVASAKAPEPPGAVFSDILSRP